VRRRPRSPREAPDKPAARVRAALVAAGLILLVALVYSGVRTAGFVNFDDRGYVSSNPEVLSGLTGHSLRWALTALRNANWHPLTWMSHMADVELFGPEPGAHHVVKAAIHAANAVVVFATRRSRPWLLFGWIWYLISLLPVIGLVQVGSQARADRYTYVPMAGIFVAAVWEVADRVRGDDRVRTAISAAAVALVAGLGISAISSFGAPGKGSRRASGRFC
jgi:hypothetical protein